MTDWDCRWPDEQREALINWGYAVCDAACDGTVLGSRGLLRSYLT